MKSFAVTFRFVWITSLLVGLYFCNPQHFRGRNFFSPKKFDVNSLSDPFNEFKNQSLVWVTVVNAGYVEYAKNFIESSVRAGVTLPLIIFCSDFKAYSSFQSKGLLQAVPFFVQTKLSLEFSSWGAREYIDLAFSKIDALRYALSLLRSRGVGHVGYIDTDGIIFLNPNHLILGLIQQFRDTDVFSQCDEPGYKHTCSSDLKCPNMCSGFLVLKNTQQVENLLVYGETDVHAHLGDQSFLRDAFDKGGLTRRSISRMKAPNGAYLGINGSTVNNTLLIPGDSLSSETTYIHFNWIVGEGKKATMKKNRLWFV